MTDEVTTAVTGHILILVCGNSIADAERARTQARLLSARGHRVTLAAPRALQGPPIATADGAVNLQTLDGDLLQSPAEPMLRVIKTQTRMISAVLRASLGADAADVVQLSGPASRLFPAALAARLTGRPVVTDVRGLTADAYATTSPVLRPGRIRSLAFLDQMALRSSDLAVISDPQLAAAGGAARSVLLRERAFDGLAPREGARERFANGRPHLVASFSDFDAGDPVNVLLRTVRRVVFGLERTDVQFAIAAPRAQHSALAQMAQADDVTAFITLVDAQDHDALSQLLSVSDALVDPAMPDMRSAGSISAFALSGAKFGVPLVAFERASVRERLGASSIMVREPQVPALADSLLDLLDFPEELAAKKRAARESFASDASFEREADAYCEAIAQLLARKARPSHDVMSHPSEATAE